MAVLHLCLRDMAYILRGTSAAFDIRPSVSDSHQFWIVRGVGYTPTGNELQTIPDRYVTRSDMGFLFGWEGADSGFPNYPEQTIVIGIDGENYPETFVTIRTIQDIDNTYFLVSDLAYILGFEDIITTERWHPGRDHPNFVEGLERIFLTETKAAAILPPQDAALLQLLIRINGNFGGHWVCETYFESEEINESVVWPAEIIFSHNGLGFPYHDSVAPGRPSWEMAIELQRNSFEPLRKRIREDGMAELYVDNQQSRFADYLIVVDPHLPSHEMITLYIGDKPHTLRWYRVGWLESPERYTVQPTEDGGVKLRYLLNRWAFGLYWDMEFLIFRATEEIEFDWSSNPLKNNRLSLMHRQTNVDMDDRIIFEFVDNTIEYGQVYYYSLWHTNGDWFINETPINETSFGNIRVDVNVLLGLPTANHNEIEEDKTLIEGEIPQTEREIPSTTPTDASETNDFENAESSTFEHTNYDDSEQSRDPVNNEDSGHLRDPVNNLVWIIIAVIVPVVLLVFFLYRRFLRQRV
jgi:hypothetical protein